MAGGELYTAAVETSDWVWAGAYIVGALVIAEIADRALSRRGTTLTVAVAARQTLANGIAGILLAITQPIRIGDLVTFEDETGVVEDVKLTYTYIRLDDGRRLVVPNERLAQSSVANHTIIDPRVQVEVSVWLPPDADVDRAIELIEDPAAGIAAVVAESAKEGVRVSATTWAPAPDERGKAGAELRRRWLRLLREHGLSSIEAS